MNDPIYTIEHYRKHIFWTNVQIALILGTVLFATVVTIIDLWN